MSRVVAFARNEQGATALEYGLIAAVIATAIVATIPLVRPGLEAALQALSDRMVAETDPLG